MKKFFFVFVFLLHFKNTSAQTKSVTEHAKQLLEISETGKLGIQIMANMVVSFKKTMPKVPQEFWDRFIKEASPDDFIEMLIPVYVKHYTDDELIDLIEFYKSPIGKKVIEKLPLISQDSMKAGSEWGKKLGEKIMNDLINSGYNIGN